MMPTEVWPVVSYNGADYYEVAGFTLVSIDPTGNTYFLVKTPDGGLGAVGPLVKGDPGLPPILSTTEIVSAELAWDDAAPVSSSWVMTDPGDSTHGPTYQRHLTARKGPPGDDGDTVLNPDDFTDPTPGQMIVVNSTSDGFELATQAIGDRYFPATIANIASGNATATLAQIPIPAQPFDWRPEVHASCVITGTGADVAVDLIARLGTTGIINPETAGNVVGTALGAPGVNPPTHILTPGPAAGAAADVDTVLAGNTAVIYLRAERQTGADYFTTTGARTRFFVKVNPIP